MPQKRDYYEVLGCAREASAEELRKAYKKEALKFHPDRNQGDPAAEAKFKEVNEAYQVLSDAEKRRVYDQFGHEGLAGGGFDGGIGDMFSHMQDLFSEMFSGGFGGQKTRRGADLRVQMRLTLREAAFGCKKEVNVRAPAPCEECAGSGAKSGTKPEVCSQCRGTGQVSAARGFVMFTSTCPKCEGQGAFVRHPCPACRGEGMVEKPRKVMVTFPAGIDSGQRLRVPGQGMAGPPNSPAGDLYVDVEVEKDPRFERDGADLVTRVHVSITEAALGADLLVPCLDPKDEEATSKIALAAGTQSGAVMQLKGKGIPRLDGRGHGSLVVVIQVDTPKELSARARELLTSLGEELRKARA